MSGFKISRLLVATHNEGKRKEFERLLSPYVENVVSAGQLNLAEPEETEDTYRGNAELKARAGAKASGLITLADDSGFGVAALGGRPGVFSQRFAKFGNGHDYDAAVQQLLQEMGLDASRAAHFICVLALANPKGEVEFVEGRCDGTLVYPGRGSNGFGYDPYFVPQGEAQTFGEMSAEEKAPLSHRGRAIEALGKFIASSAKPDWLAAA